MYLKKRIPNAEIHHSRFCVFHLLFLPKNYHNSVEYHVKNTQVVFEAAAMATLTLLVVQPYGAIMLYNHMYNHVVQSCCTTILYNHIVQPYCTTMLYNHFVQSCCTTILYNHVVQPCCTTILYNHVVQSRRTTILYSHVVQLYCTVMLYNHIVQS